MSPFCEICEKPFNDRLLDHAADCIICGQECCKDCIAEHSSICKECNTDYRSKPLPKPDLKAWTDATMKKKVYYAHCIAIYNTPQEKRDIEALEAMGFEVANPNSPECAEGYKRHGMEFFKQFASTCDLIAFRALPDGAIPAGVGTEILFFVEAKKPVLELPSNYLRRLMTVEQTREYLKEVGQR